MACELEWLAASFCTAHKQRMVSTIFKWLKKINHDT